MSAKVGEVQREKEHLKNSSMSCCHRICVAVKLIKGHRLISTKTLTFSWIIKTEEATQNSSKISSSLDEPFKSNYQEKKS